MTDQFISQPVDQHLTLINAHAKTNRLGDNPPTLMLVLDIEHDETKTQWRQELTVSRERWVSLMQLLSYAAKNEGVAWE